MARVPRQLDIIRDLQGQAGSLRGAELVLAAKISDRIAKAEKVTADAQKAALAAAAAAQAASAAAQAAGAAAQAAGAAAQAADVAAARANARADVLEWTDVFTATPTTISPVVPRHPSNLSEVVAPIPEMGLWVDTGGFPCVVMFSIELVSAHYVPGWAGVSIGLEIPGGGIWAATRRYTNLFDNADLENVSLIWSWINPPAGQQPFRMWWGHRVNDPANPVASPKGLETRRNLTVLRVGTP